MNPHPIGVFDSGIGGLTVANAIARRLPSEQMIYFGDTAHLPYGDKSADALRYYSLKIAKFLLEQGCKIIVIACNSAATAAADVLTEFYGERVPIVTVVSPLVDTVAATMAAAGQPRLKKVGVIATKATIASGAYQRQLQMLPNGQHAALEVAALATPLLVPMIEEGFFEDNISHAIIHNYLSHPSLAGIEGLLLACTHYPLIRTEIATYYAERGEAVHIFDPNLACADRVASILAERGWLNDAVDASVSPTHRFFVSDLTPSFAQTTRLFYPSAQVVLEKADIWI